jgi:hemerythrin-like domain-containing protein
MKRHPVLQPLSDDHHRALILARRLRRLAASGDAVDLRDLSREVRRTFEADLAPHFAVEEEVLLPALRDAGVADPVDRTLDDHARIRALVAGAWTDATVRALGALLERHVRFEERELFPAAEQVLSADVLEAIGRRTAPMDRRPRRG